MDRNEKYGLLSTGRGGELRNLVLGMTNDPRDLPSVSEMKEELARIYPGDEHAERRQAMFGKLKKIAEARRDGMDLMELRGICDEYVVKVETELHEADRLLPVEDTEPVDVSGLLSGIDNFDPTQKNLRAINEAAKQAELDANLARQRAGL